MCGGAVCGCKGDPTDDFPDNPNGSLHGAGYQIQLVEFWDDASSRSVSISGESSTMGCAETGRFAT